MTTPDTLPTWFHKGMMYQGHRGFKKWCFQRISSKGGLLCGFLLIGWLFSIRPAMSQDYLYFTKNITIDLNRAHKDVHCVVQDDVGFFWAATWNGLYRYDGFNTEHVQIMPGDAPIRIEDMILRNGHLYLATEKGLKCLRIADRKIIPLKGVPTTDSIMRVTTDNAGRLWCLGFRGKVYRYDGKELRTLQIDQYNSSVFGSLEVADGFIWVSAHDRKLFMIDPETLEIIRRIETPAGAFINNIIRDPDGRLQLLCDDAVYQVDLQDPKGPHLQSRPEFGKEVTQLLFTPKGIFIVRDRNRFGHLYRIGGKDIYYEIPWMQEKPENTNRIKLFGEVLMVCYRSGMLMVNIARNHFDPLHITYQPKINQIETARGIEEDDTNIYLATYDAVYAVDKRTGRESELIRGEYLFRDIMRSGDTLWVASEGKGLLRANLKSGKITRVGMANLPKNQILICVSPLGKDRLLVGGYDGLTIYEKKSDLQHEIRLIHNGRQVQPGLVFQTEAVGGNQFLVATQAGLFLADDQGKVLLRYGADLIGERGMEALCFWRAPDGTIWVGTTGGLFHISGDGRILKRLNIEDGLSGDIIATITPDRMGRIWVATYNGLSCIRLSDMLIRNFRKEDGLPDNEFNQVSNRLLNDDKLILGTMNGFIRFDPQSFPNQTKNAKRIQLSRIEKGDQLKKTIDYLYGRHELKEIRIGKGINYAKISFAVLPMGLNTGTVFEYKIRGVHQDWIRMGLDPTIVIDNFRKGNYVVEVRAITGLGSREIVSLELPLVVEEYFFREIWFYVLMITLMLSTLILFLYSQLQKKKRIEEVRHELSQNLHDEMGTYLTTIGMNADMLTARLPENRNLESIRKMSRHAMDFIKDNLWTLDSSSDNALQLWDRIKAFTSESCEGLDIRCEFNEIPGLEHVKLSMKQKNNLLLIAKELVNNAIKHGDRKLIKLEWINDAAGHRMLMTNRVGTVKAEGSGSGMLNVSRRIEELGGTMTGVQQEDQFFVTIWMKFIK
jgi:ligand-binding sensor domain-containing protein/two-component sensor histidine kinase